MKHNLRYYFKIYIKIIAQDIKSKMSFRSDFLISLIGMLAANIVGFVSLWIICNNFPTIMGWSYHEMLFLYGFSLIAFTPQQCLFENNWSLQANVYTGDFIKYRFRPINIFFYYYSETFDIKGFTHFAFGIFTLIYAWVKLGLGFSFIIFMKLLLGLISASIIIIAIMIIAASTSFYIVNIGLFMNIATRFKDYAQYPVTIFRGVFKMIFTFIIPIGFMAYYPSLLVLDKDSNFLMYFTPFYGIILLYISYKIWMRGERMYNGTGT